MKQVLIGMAASAFAFAACYALMEYAKAPSAGGVQLQPECAGVMCASDNAIRVVRDGRCYCAQPVVCVQ